MRRLLLSMLLLAGCASATSANPITAAPVIAAERAFAARAGEIGWIAAFREYAAPDGQLAQAEIVSAPEALAAAPGDGARTLYWQPAFAGIARSGDLGFTRLVRIVGSAAGDMVFTLGEADWEGGRAYFARIWQLRPEGWRIVYDQLAPRASPAN